MSETRVLCKGCASAYWPWHLERTDMFSVDGCDDCHDGKAGHELYVMRDTSDTRPHTITRNVAVGDVVLYYADDPNDPMGWSFPSTVERIERTPRQTFSGPVRYDASLILASGVTLDATKAHKVTP